jgi:hypothetical protein
MNAYDTLASIAYVLFMAAIIFMLVAVVKDG